MARWTYPSYRPVKAGDRFDRLVVLEDREIGMKKIRVRCDCGTEKAVWANSLASGTIRSCGCLMREVSAVQLRANRTSPRTHGMSDTPTYQSWQAMIARCTYPNQKGWKDYGGRGIVVCERWRESFENFLADMGVKPEWATGGIDRIDNDGNYEPGNCRWATKSEQNSNQRPRRAA